MDQVVAQSLTTFKKIVQQETGLGLAATIPRAVNSRANGSGKSSGNESMSGVHKNGVSL